MIPDFPIGHPLGVKEHPIAQCAENRHRGLVERALLCITIMSAACAMDTLPPDTGDNVIVITLDGVRARDVFGGPDPALSAGDHEPTMPALMGSLLDGAVMYGDPLRLQSMTTANPAQVSIPGYMSIFTGYEQPCYNNSCAMVGVETVLEYVQRVRGLRFGEVAAFTSWSKMGRALEQVVGTVVTDIGPPDGAPAAPREWTNARWDRDTFAAAMDYLVRERPRLLYIGLLDSDGWGHADRYGEYVRTLRQYDAWIAEVKAQLAELGDYGARTTIIVTTDHGRGDGDLWTDHNAFLPGSDRVWLYASGPHVTGGPWPEGRHSHADIRPTLEVLFGLPPSTCARCGRPLVEVVGGGT